MAEEFQLGSGSWWDSSSRTRYDSGSTQASTTLNTLGNFGWSSPEIVDNKARSSMDSSASVSNSSIVFPDTQKLQLHGHDSSSGSSVLTDPSLQMMGLGLSSQAVDWNQALFRGGKAESSFRSMLQEDMNTSYQQQDQWRQKIYSNTSDHHQESSVNDFKQMNRGFSLDQPQPQYSSHVSSNDTSATTCQQGLPTSFQMDSSSAAYGGTSPTILQGLLVPDQNQPQPSTMNYSNYPSSNYGVNTGEQLMPSWSKVPQFLRGPTPKQLPAAHSQLHFSNNTPYWNASASSMVDARPSFFPTLQTQITSQTFDEKPKTVSEVRDLNTVAKKTSSEPSNKRPRNETPSPLPAFKVRKEKMGDRITALQQLVSPFGKTDTASVLSEAIEYIKFLHEQVGLLSTPYMKSGAPIQHQQQSCEKSSNKDPAAEGPKQDLRSRGLCLVPVSSTFPVTHETTVDFWTPTFGGTFR